MSAKTKMSYFNPTARAGINKHIGVYDRCGADTPLRELVYAVPQRVERSADLRSGGHALSNDSGSYMLLGDKRTDSSFSVEHLSVRLYFVTKQYNSVPVSRR